MLLKHKVTSDGVMVSVYVHPSSKRDKIETTDEIIIYTKEPAEDNRANIAVTKILSKALGIPRSNISIVRGSTSRVKELHIAGVSPDQSGRLISKSGIEKIHR